MNSRKREQLEGVAGPVSRETFDRLEAFEAAFIRWAGRINLVAPSTLCSVWTRHILDSAQLFRLAPANALRWVDLGSGGGFPGAVLAILLAERSGAEIHLVESNGKKSAFLRTVLAGIEAPAQVHRVRIEDALRVTGPAQVITARALAPLDRLLGLARPWLDQDARALFHKGRDYSVELEESRDRWQFDLVIHTDAIDCQGRILEITALRDASAARSVQRPD